MSGAEREPGNTSRVGLDDGQGQVCTLSLVILLVEPVPAEFHGGKHTPPGSVRGTARMSRWREMDARRKTHKHKRAKPDRTHKEKGDPNPSPSATGPEIAWGPNFPNGDP